MRLFSEYIRGENVWAVELTEDNIIPTVASLGGSVQFRANGRVMHGTVDNTVFRVGDFMTSTGGKLADPETYTRISED